MTNRSQEIFERVVALSEPERAAALGRECAGDERLRAEVEALLASWDRPTVAGPITAVRSERSEGPGSRIGPYRLVRSIGEGGFGSVFLAEQESPVVRRVAIKIIKLGMDTKRVIARFEAERQALALMDHPAIAKVFDAGETPRGLPFFAMEYVPGEPLTQYCDRGKLTNEARLRLFSEVCLGVQHAHQKGIIHRDLKPSNLLVTTQDGRPVPKIIDFGIAKATAQRLTEKTLFTELGAMIGTPEYMSPEQAEMSGLDVDTRADVYSLGVILYELVTGVLPFDSAAIRQASFEEFRRWIREVDPPPPSVRVSRAGNESVETAANRQTDPARLASRLHGELDWIVMKAIEKDRTRRYASPSEVAADIARLLADEPVTARPPSTSYRARKFVKRHRFGVAVAGFAVVGLAAFAVTMGIQARRTAMQRDRAERVSAFLTELFGAANPAHAKGRTVTARDLLDEGAARIEQDRSVEPLVRAQLMHTMGAAYRVLGLCAEASRVLKPALEVRTAQLGGSDPETLSTMTELGGAFWCSGQLADAEAQFRLVAERSQAAFGPDSEVAIQAAHSLGGVLRETGRFDEAEAAQRSALERAQRIMGPEHRLTLAILSDLSTVVAMRDAAQALPLVRDLIPRVRAAVGEDDPLYVVALANLAADLEATGDRDGAISVARNALERSRRILGDDAPNTMNLAQILAVSYGRQKRYDEAETFARTYIEGLQRTQGPEAAQVLDGKEILGGIFMGQKRYAEAVHIRADVLAVRRRVFGESSPAVAPLMYNLACSLALDGKRDQAIDLLRQSVAHGFNDADLMSKDTDLASLHDDPRFEAVVAEAGKKTLP